MSASSRSSADAGSASAPTGIAPRITVLVSVLLETWDEGRSPTYFPRTTPLKAGARDEAGIQWAGYGPREGIWRLMRIVESHGLQATAFCNGLAATRCPEAVARLAAGGHDIAAHGWAQNEYLYEQGADGQAATIARTIDALEKVAGRRPQGWLTPVYGGDGHTSDLLAAAGLAWHCDVLDASSPRLETRAVPGVAGASRTIVGIPWSEFVDNRVLRSSPRDYFDVYQGAFDFLYRTEPGATLHLGIHAHFGGRPLVSAMLDEVLTHMRGHEGVAFMTCSQLAARVSGEAPGAREFRTRFFGQ
jgi:ribosomal protein S18 acetylase RimI-like enzyme